MGVLQARGDLDFSEKPFGAEAHGQVRMEHLEGDRSSVAKILR
jgi:hypothetical protein